jgi:hypothetical protein
MAVDVVTEVEIRRPRAEVAAPLMAGAMRRANRKDLARLKSILETGGRSA